MESLKQKLINLFPDYEVRVTEVPGDGTVTDPIQIIYVKNGLTSTYMTSTSAVLDELNDGQSNYKDRIDKDVDWAIARGK